MHKLAKLYLLVGLVACSTAQAQDVQYQYQPVLQYRGAQGGHGAQPVQYRLAQAAQAPLQYEFVQYRPQGTPQVKEDQGEQVRYVTLQQQQQPAQGTSQPLLGNVDRQIQKAAQHVAGPSYAAAITSAQLAERQAQAQAQVQRNALRLATAPRAQPLQYQRALRPSPQQLEEQGELPEQYNHNPSYQFGFDVKDDLYTNYQNRKEQREGDKITGSYSVVDSDGYIRTVTYTADPKEGFKAEVQRQPTDIVVKIPTPQPPVDKQAYQSAPQLQYRQPQYIEVPAHTQAASAGDKQRYVYQYQ